MRLARTIVVDGASAAYSELSDGDKPKVYIKGACGTLEGKGPRQMVIVRARPGHEIDDPEQLEALIDQRAIRQASSGTEADHLILKAAEQQNAQVVSNDRFERYTDKYTRIEERRGPLMIVDGKVEVYEVSLRNQSSDAGLTGVDLASRYGLAR